MSPSVWTELDSSVASLVAEVVRDPRARVFSLPGATADSDLAVEARTRTDVLSPAAAGLVLAERHLLRVHRAEVGFLLREAFCRSFTRATRAQRAYTRRFELSAETEWQSRAALELEGAGRRRDEAEQTLATLAGGDSHTDVLGQYTPAELAAIALRFECNDQARIYCAAELQQRGQHRASSEILGRVLDGNPQAVHAWCAWRNLGFSELTLGRRWRALELYERAARIGEVQTDLWGYVFALALALDDPRRALYAAGQIDELETNPDAAWMRELRSDLSEFGVVQSSESARVRSCLRRIVDHLGPVSTEMAHAFPV